MQPLVFFAVMYLILHGAQSLSILNEHITYEHESVSKLLCELTPTVLFRFCEPKRNCGGKFSQTT